MESVECFKFSRKYGDWHFCTDLLLTVQIHSSHFLTGSGAFAWFPDKLHWFNMIPSHWKTYISEGRFRNSVSAEWEWKVFSSDWFLRKLHPSKERFLHCIEFAHFKDLLISCTCMLIRDFHIRKKDCGVGLCQLATLSYWSEHYHLLNPIGPYDPAEYFFLRVFHGRPWLMKIYSANGDRCHIDRNCTIRNWDIPICRLRYGDIRHAFSILRRDAYRYPIQWDTTRFMPLSRGEK